MGPCQLGLIFLLKQGRRRLRIRHPGTLPPDSDLAPNALAVERDWMLKIRNFCCRLLVCHCVLSVANPRERFGLAARKLSPHARLFRYSFTPSGHEKSCRTFFRSIPFFELPSSGWGTGFSTATFAKIPRVHSAFLTFFGVPLPFWKRCEGALVALHHQTPPRVRNPEYGFCLMGADAGAIRI
jgi:hypothetical protein